jgi:transcription elongation factor GreB
MTNDQKLLKSKLGCKFGRSFRKCRLSINKQILRKIDRRVRYLGKRLEELKIVDYMPEQEGKVYFGAWVEIENDDGEQKNYGLLG